MINKSNLWFLTLFSLILVLGVYYVTLPNSSLEPISVKNSSSVSKTKTNSLTALRVSLTEEREEDAKRLEKELVNTDISVNEKNNIYERLKYLNEVQGREEALEKSLKSSLGLDCFTKIDSSNVEVICLSKESNKHLANNIMRSVQKGNKERLSITVKFRK